MSKLTPRTYQLEDCTITVRGWTCCGVDHWYAELPGNQGCCEAMSHGSPDTAVYCARQRLEADILVALEPLVEAG